MIDYGIEVGQNSYYYWLDDAKIFGKQTPIAIAIPLWVGADVVGALFGGCDSMWSQRNNAHFDWTDIGGHALIRGVTASVLCCSRFLKLFH